jgi:hypothetical protein
MGSPISALVDTFTQAVLALSAYPSIVSVLAKSQPLEAEQIHAVNWPNYQQKFPLGSVAPQTYPNWKWEGANERRFVPTAKDLVTPDLQRRSQLAIKKVEVLGRISVELSMLRFPVLRGVLGQELVYAAKRAQAQHYKDHPKRDVLNYPYVLQYADLSSLTPHQAADEILFKAHLDDEVLLRTEFIRLKYFELINDATKMDDFEPIIKDFRHDAYGSRHDRGDIV